VPFRALFFEELLQRPCRKSRVATAALAGDGNPPSYSHRLTSLCLQGIVCKFAALALYFSDGDEFTMNLVRFYSPNLVEGMLSKKFATP
jgi:hypothetical protein